MLLNVEKWLNALIREAHGIVLGPYWGETKPRRRGRRLARGERVTDG